ncbi:hypothetical protein L6R29_21030 [Myxococcota bacterium]|nr:hypothetical protein [Myxococcota bacterium]
MSDQTITRKQFTQATVSANNPDLQKILKNNYNQAFDTNGDGKLDASDFGVNKDGTISKEGMERLFAFATFYQSNENAKAVKNQGVVGELYSAIRQENASPSPKTSAAYRSNTADKPLTAEEKQIAQTAFLRIKSQIPSNLHAQMQEKLQKLARNGQLNWLKDSSLTPKAQSFALLEQLTSSKQANEIAAFAKNPRIQQAFIENGLSVSPKILQEKELVQTLFLRLASKSGNEFATRIFEHFDSSNLSRTQQTQILSVLLAHPNHAKTLAALPKEKIAEALQTMAKDISQFQQLASSADSGINSATQIDRTTQAAKALKEKPWLLYSLPANEAQKLITTFVHALGQTEAAKTSPRDEKFQQEIIKDALLGLKKDSPKMYSVLFGAAYQSVTNNPLPNWKEHLLSLAANLGASTLPLGAFKPFFGSAVSFEVSRATGMSNGTAAADAITGLANDLLMGVLGLGSAGALAIILKTTLTVSADLIRNELAQTGIGRFLSKAENANILP